MASITARNGAWRVRVVRKGAPTACKTFKSKRDAQAWAAIVESEIARGVFQRHEGERITLAELLQRYLETVTPAKRGALQERNRALALLRPDSAARKLTCKAVASITAADVAAWRDKRLKDVSGSTFNRELALFSAVLVVAAQEWGYVGLANPFRQVRKPAENKARDRRITADELEAICAAAVRSAELPTIIRLAVETAARRSELLALRWQDIDLAARTATLRQTKNGHVRVIPLSPTACKLLEALPRQLDGRVFTLSAGHVSQGFLTAVRRARKAYEAAGGSDPAYLVGIRLHDARHEACSRLAEAGLSTLELAAVSGHRTLQLVGRYTHLRPADLADKLAAIHDAQAAVKKPATRKVA